ncbi:hypothetical protein [Bartonella tribocorum]|uniref:hypothetical protein n=1 Tax=Bartonella tribocorum TaxID=85701 RepID=UPI0002EE44EC|nr:hypothetical protein [Bartonella tribocorum]
MLSCKCVDGMVRKKGGGAKGCVREWGGLLVSFYEMMLFGAWGDEKILMRKDVSCWQ